ncbi:MAG TPA: NUDIX hydrolase [Candidatus Saccharimonadales bacterium]|nr:NUDIX hydrolase [Candidatus Saccharimonadales bacterium]
MPRTFAKVLVVNDAGELLILRRSSTDEDRPGGWDFPGGTVDQGETFLQAAVREASEEAGLTVRQPLLVYGKSDARPWGKGVWLYYLEFVTGHPTVTLSFEHDRYEWVQPEAFLAMTDYPKHHEIITFIREHALLSNPPVTLAMATGRTVLTNAKGELLIVRRSGTDETFYGGTWDLPGGQAEAGEDISQTAIRETKEEVGMDIKHAVPLFAISKPRREGTGTWVFFGASAPQEIPTLSWEHDEYKWIPLADLPQYTDYEILLAMTTFVQD